MVSALSPGIICWHDFAALAQAFANYLQHQLMHDLHGLQHTACILGMLEKITTPPVLML